MKILSILEFTYSYNLVNYSFSAVRKLWNELCKSETDLEWISASTLNFELFPSLTLHVFNVEFVVVCVGKKPESRAVIPAGQSFSEEEALRVDFDLLLWGNMIVEEGVEEAAEEHEDGEGPVPGVGAVACKTEDDDEEHDVPAHCPVVSWV